MTQAISVYISKATFGLTLSDAHSDILGYTLELGTTEVHHYTE